MTLSKKQRAKLSDILFNAEMKKDWDTAKMAERALTGDRSAFESLTGDVPRGGASSKTGSSSSPSPK